MDLTTNLQLAERIERLEAICGRLERRAWRWRMAAGGLALLGAIILVIGGAGRDDREKRIEAEQFVLVDKAGVERAALCMEPDGSPRLNFRRTDGRCSLSVGMEMDGSTGLSFYDDQEQIRVGMRFRPDQEAGLAFFRNGEKKIGLGLNPDGEAVLGLCGRDGHSAMQMRAQVEGTCDLVAFGSNKSKIFNLHVDGNGKPFLGLFDKDGQSLFRVPDLKVEGAK